MDRDNRKSHLAPQLSPATQDLLRSSDSPTFATQQTPTSCKNPTLRTTVLHVLTEIAVYRIDPRQAADHNLAAQVDRLYIREWDQE